MLSSWDVWATLVVALAAACIAWAQPAVDASAHPDAVSVLERVASSDR